MQLTSGITMSILLVEIVPQGIIFGADRNVTHSRIMQKRFEQNEKTIIEVREEVYGQSQRPKILRWPQRKAVIGYVGAAQIGDMPTDEWLYDFIGNNLNFPSFEHLSETLRLAVETQRQLDEGNSGPEPLIIHLGGFEEKDGVIAPSVWVVRNVWGYGPTGYEDTRKEFEKRDAFWEAFSTISPQNIRNHLAKKANNYDPFWFHQGFDLGVFNIIEDFLKSAFKVLCETSDQHHVPQTIQEWEQQVNMSILTYGAYFQSYKGPSEQYVGGGADIISVEWP